MTKAKLRRGLKQARVWADRRMSRRAILIRALSAVGLILISNLMKAVGLGVPAFLFALGAALLVGGTLALFGVALWLNAALEALSDKQGRTGAVLALLALGSLLVYAGCAVVYAFVAA
jgi:hypothetical protein